MTLKELLDEDGKDILPSERVYIIDPYECFTYSGDFWNLYDNPLFHDILNREAVRSGWRLYLLKPIKSQKSQLV